MILVLTVVIIRQRMILAVIVPLIATSAWSGLHQQRLDRNDLLAIAGHGDDPILVQLTGRVQSVAGLRIQLRVTGWREGSEIIPARGRVVLRLPHTTGNPLEGRFIEVAGWLRRIQASESGDGVDWLSLAIDGSYRGWMPIESMDLIRVLPEAFESPAAIVNRLRGQVKDRLLAPPMAMDGPVRSLAMALLLGLHDHEWKNVAPSFRRIGVAHLLAISGLHVGLVAGMIAALLTVIPVGPRTRWGMVLAGMAMYLLMVQWRPPVIRAGLMSLGAGMAMLGGLRIRGMGLLSLAAIIIVVIQPGQVARAGFQLSFVVVLGLMIGAPRVRRRWFGPADPHASTMSAVLSQCGMTMLAAAVTAWLISVPLVIHHFGQFSPLGVPLGLLMMIPVIIMLAGGLLRLLLGWIPEADEALGWLLDATGSVILETVSRIDSWRWSCVESIDLHWSWTVLSLGWSAAWCVQERFRLLLWLTSVPLVLWIVIFRSPPQFGLLP